MNLRHMRWLLILCLCAGVANARLSRTDLIDYLHSISGLHTISGQHNREPNSDPTKWTRVVRDITGKLPGLWGGDFLFLPDDVRDRQTMIDEAIRQWNAGSLVALTWHVCPPTVGETCNWDSDGVLAQLEDWQWNDLVTDGWTLNQAWKRRVDTIVPYLRQLDEAGVVAIWRPIHEINEGWSWWGGRPGPQGSRKLYELTYDYMVNVHGLQNLVWTWNVKDVQMGSIRDYWPRDDAVDVASLDMWVNRYPTDSDYNRMLEVAEGKPISLAEVGSVPDPGLLARQSRWTWFMVWAEYLKDPAFNSDASVQATYYSPRVYSQGDLDIGDGDLGPNFALNRPVRASSVDGPGHEPELTVDGSRTTRWSSDYTDEQWIYVDLGQERSIRHIKIHWEAAYARAYQVQVALDDTTAFWTTVHENYNGDGGLDVISLDMFPPTARYLKIFAFSMATEFGYSIYELEVYG